MEAESPAAAAGSARPRPVLLALLGLVVAVFLFSWLRDSAGSGVPSSNPGTRAAAPGQDATIDPAALDVQLEALAGDRPEPGDSERNPFRFRPKAPPPEPAPERTRPAGPPMPADVPSGPPPPPPVPPITVKFLGTVELPDGTTRAVFTDCTNGRQTTHAREGEPVLGQYRLVKIGVQSVVIEHLDGRGRTTLAKTGEACVWK